MHHPPPRGPGHSKLPMRRVSFLTEEPHYIIIGAQQILSIHVCTCDRGLVRLFFMLRFDLHAARGGNRLSLMTIFLCRTWPLGAGGCGYGGCMSGCCDSASIVMVYAGIDGAALMIKNPWIPRVRIIIINLSMIIQFTQ